MGKSRVFFMIKKRALVRFAIVLLFSMPYRCIRKGSIQYRFIATRNTIRKSKKTSADTELK